MAQSEVDIANRALIRLGLQPIDGTATSFSTLIAAGDKKQSLALLNIHFGDWLNEVLRSHPWNFAVKRQTLIKPTALSPQSFDIRAFRPGTGTSGRYDGTDDSNVDTTFLNNPVVIDLRSKEFTTGPQEISPTDWGYYEHGLEDAQAVYIENTPHSILNGKWFYIKRGYNNGTGDATKRTGGSLTEETWTIALYNKLGDTNSSAFQTPGGVPATGTGDTYGYSVNGSAVKNSVRGPNTEYTLGLSLIHISEPTRP